MCWASNRETVMATSTIKQWQQLVSKIWTLKPVSQSVGEKKTSTQLYRAVRRSKKCHHQHECNTNGNYAQNAMHDSNGSQILCAICVCALFYSSSLPPFAMAHTDQYTMKRHEKWNSIKCASMILSTKQKRKKDVSTWYRNWMAYFINNISAFHFNASMFACCKSNTNKPCKIKATTKERKNKRVNAMVSREQCRHGRKRGSHPAKRCWWTVFSYSLVSPRRLQHFITRLIFYFSTNQ